MAEAGLDIPAGYIVESSFNEVGGATAAAALLRLTPRPTAIVAANAVCRRGGDGGGAQRGPVRCPEDISMVGLHDIPQAAYLNPPLTTVRMPLAELGSRSVDMLLSDDHGAPVAACGCGDARPS